MASSLDSRRWIVLAALAVATLSLSACTAARAPSAAERSSSARTERATTVVDGTGAERPESESEPISVDLGPRANGDSSVPGDSERSRTQPKSPLIVIDQYPPNPRCYAAGRYIPAPPLCPSL